MNRGHRAELGRDTLTVIESGCYRLPAGGSVSLQADLERLRRETVVYTPEALVAVQSSLAPFTGACASVDVTGETTLEAARRLVSCSPEPVLCLNFASAKNPGGGFLSGAQAQEESLARASLLYASQLVGREMYEHNRRFGSNLYSDYMIYSPAVPVFRDEAGEPLAEPFRVSFLTAAAVNAGAIKEHERAQVDEVMSRRTAFVHAVAARHGYRRLVLGAWGCGVFRNEPTRVAGWFRDCLNGAFQGAFSEVVFAVYDRSDNRATLRAFEGAFPKAAT